MKDILRYLIVSTFIFTLSPLLSQTKSTGPVLKEFGEVFLVTDPDFKLDTTMEFKAVFDVMDSPESYGARNKGLETAARFLNMHAQSGVPISQLKAAIVVHNNASKDMLSNEAYRKHYGMDNPNTKLIQALLHADVQIIFCGQSSAARGFPREDLLEGVQLSLSAMSALIQLQNESYQLIKF